MFDYWVVTDKTTGKVIAHCGEENDALMLVGFDKDKRTYRILYRPGDLTKTGSLIYPYQGTFNLIEEIIDVGFLGIFSTTTVYRFTIGNRRGEWVAIRCTTVHQGRTSETSESAAQHNLLRLQGLKE